LTDRFRLFPYTTLFRSTRLVVSWIRAPLLEENKNADPFSESAQLYAAGNGCVVARTPAAHLEHRGPEGGAIRPDRPLIALSGRKIDWLRSPCKLATQLPRPSFSA